MEGQTMLKSISASVAAGVAAVVTAVVTVKQALGAVRARPRRRKADRRLLLGLNDHLLADLGLTRADIQGVVWGVVPVTAVGEREPSAEVVPLRPSATTAELRAAA
jgi:uncharacterized protein YjiS (DUF1127 family)